jgi:hypothetical protein
LTVEIFFIADYNYNYLLIMDNNTPSSLPQDLLMPAGSQMNPIRERTLANIAILEKKFNERDFSSILPAQKKTLID